MNLTARYNQRSIVAKEIKIDDLLIVVGYRIPIGDLIENYTLKIGEIVKVYRTEDCLVNDEKVCNGCPSGARAFFVSKPGDKKQRTYASCWYRFRTLNDGRLII